MAGAGRETLRFPEILLWASIPYFLAGWTCSDTPPPTPAQRQLKPWPGRRCMQCRPEPPPDPRSAFSIQHKFDGRPQSFGV